MPLGAGTLHSWKLIWEPAMIAVISLIFLANINAAFAQESTSTSFQIQDQWITTGGGFFTSSSFELRGSAGQAAPGKSSSTNFEIRSGILYYTEPSAASSSSSPSPTVLGGSPGPAAHNPPTPPAGGFGIVINNWAATTTDHKVVLTIYGGEDTAYVLVSEDGDFKDAKQIWYNGDFEKISLIFNLSAEQGEKTLYAKFYTRFGVEAAGTFSDSIELVPNAPEKTFFDRVIDILRPIIPDALEPKLKRESKETVVQKETPLALRGKWFLLPRKPIREFALAPLPKEIMNLANKLPSIRKIFMDTGINKLNDLIAIRNTPLKVPGFTEIAKESIPSQSLLTMPGFKSGQLSGIPVSKLSDKAKQGLPTEFIFVKGSKELVDLQTTFSISDAGKPRQTVNAVAGQELHFSVKPEYPAKTVRGLLLLDSFMASDLSKHEPKKLLAALGYALRDKKPTPNDKKMTEERLLLWEFEYTDPDNDGIYTADITAPGIGGAYEIITVIYYKDSDLGEKELRLTVVVDPEGYVYEKVGNQELRISGAAVTLYRLNESSSKYELWDAVKYGQKNPQVTGVRGAYAFLVPPGEYHLGVDAPGYPFYQGKSFIVEEGRSIHINIELKKKFWRLGHFNKYTAALLVVILLLLYNFYSDKIREKELFKNI